MARWLATEQSVLEGVAWELLFLPVLGLDAALPLTGGGSEAGGGEVYRS